MEDVLPILFVAFIVTAFLTSIVRAALRTRKFARMSVVQPGVEYPNNHHVMGVGYYHAASGMWFAHPWNEFREDQGYYWDGGWHAEPDQRMVLKSLPSQAEADRVNRQWRKADPDRMRRFWQVVEREGFGTAIRRSEGS